MKKKKEEETHRTRNTIITIIIIIIIILLLLRKCCRDRKGIRKGYGNDINICDSGDCNPKTMQGILINCIEEYDEDVCLLPDFKGKTKEDIKKWLSKIVNNVEFKYEMVPSDEKEGTILSQSVKSGTSVKSIFDNKIQIIIYVSSPKESIPSNNTNNKNNKREEQQEDQEEEEEPVYEDEIKVYDPKKVWVTETEIDIFNNSLANEKIAPESSNTYQFTINNKTIYDVTYTVKFIETNNYNINMKYKLRRNNTYIVDEYVSINDITVLEHALDSLKSDTYYLEWKWISSDNDMEIGTTPNANYELRIEVEAEGTDE